MINFGYAVIVPHPPGCVTYGVTIDEAIGMARGVIELYIGSLKNREKKYQRKKIHSNTH